MEEREEEAMVEESLRAEMRLMVAEGDLTIEPSFCWERRLTAGAVEEPVGAEILERVPEEAMPSATEDRGWGTSEGSLTEVFLGLELCWALFSWTEGGEGVIFSESFEAALALRSRLVEEWLMTW